MRITNDDEKKVIRAMLDFANLKKIRSAKQVEALFSPLADDRFQTIPEKDKKAYRENDQKELIRWLDEISKNGAIGREKVRLEINDRLKTVHIRPIIQDGKAKYRLIVEGVGLSIDGVRAAYAYALWLILDEKRKLISRLNKCGAPGCGRFRLDFEGRPRKYCNEKHRKEADKIPARTRVKEWRGRQK